MAIKSYIVTQSFKTPLVRVTGMAHKPQEIRFKQFRKGDIVKGELKHANNKPAFVLVGSQLVVPLNAVKELVTKEIVSSADGESKPQEKVKITPNKDPKMKYLDAVILGGLAGFGGVYLAEKQGWIPNVDKKNRIYGALVGAAAGLYLVYRFKMNKAKPKTEE
jgi:hypothetical protein